MNMAVKRGRPKSTRPKIDKGTLQTRYQHARVFLCLKDRARLEMLVNWSPERLLEAGEIQLGSKRRATAEEAVAEERERLLNKAANAPHAAQRKDPIGRAWYERLLDGHGVEASVLREKGRDYAWLYWFELRKLNASIGAYDAMIGRNNVKRTFEMSSLEGPAERRFAAYERVLAPLGPNVRQALQRLCVDDMWWLDGPPWLDRCINSRREERIASGEPGVEAPEGDTANRGDLLTLSYAIAGLKALALGHS